MRSSQVVQWVKDLVLSLLWLGFQLWTSDLLHAAAKKKKEKNTNKNFSSWELEIGTCHLPLQGLTHEHLTLNTSGKRSSW